MKRRKSRSRRKNLLQRHRTKIPYLLITISVVLSFFFFKSNDLVTSFLFIVLAPLFLYFNYDGRFAITYALLLFVLAAILLAFRNDVNNTNTVLVYAFWLLVVGVACLTINYARENRRK